MPLPGLFVTLLFIAAPGPVAALGVVWEEPVEVATGSAWQGPWRMNESEFLYVDDPAVAINETGVTGIVWANNAERDIYVQIYETDGTQRLQTPVNISRSPDTFSWLPRLVISEDNADRIFILWQEIIFSGGSHGGEILFARSQDGGRTFSNPVNLSNTTAGAGKGRLSTHFWHNGSLDLARDSAGRLHAAWTEYEGRLWHSHSTDGGNRFSAPLHVSGTGRLPARGPTLAVDDGDTVYLAWTVGEDPAADIHFTVSGDNGRSFAPPRTVDGSNGHADAPKLAIDKAGIVHLVYGESPAGPWQRYHIRHARSENSGTNFTSAREISHPQSEQYASVNFPALGTDDTGIYVLWELFPDLRNRSQGLGFTWTANGGGHFAAPMLVPGSTGPDTAINGSLQGLLMNKLAVNAKGRIALVNSHFDRGRSSRILLIRGQVEPTTAVNTQRD